MARIFHKMQRRKRFKYHILIPKAIKRQREFGKQLVIPCIVEFAVSYCATFAYIHAVSRHVVGRYVIGPLASNFAGRYISPGGREKSPRSCIYIYTLQNRREICRKLENITPGERAPRFQLLPMLPFLGLGFRPEKRHVGKSNCPLRGDSRYSGIDASCPR